MRKQVYRTLNLSAREQHYITIHLSQLIESVKKEGNYENVEIHQVVVISESTQISTSHSSTYATRYLVIFNVE